jgi:hypothetical protein
VWAAFSAGLAGPSWSDAALDRLTTGSGDPYLAQLQPGNAPPTSPIPEPAPGQAGPKEPGAPAQPVRPGEPKPWYTPVTRWFNPKTAPFIPVPEIAVDPDSGTTLGLIFTVLVTDENDDIRKIIAPDLIYNPYFGWGVNNGRWSRAFRSEWNGNSTASIKSGASGRIAGPSTAA